MQRQNAAAKSQARLKGLDRPASGGWTVWLFSMSCKSAEQAVVAAGEAEGKQCTSLPGVFSALGRCSEGQGSSCGVLQAACASAQLHEGGPLTLLRNLGLAHCLPGDRACAGAQGAITHGWQPPRACSTENVRCGHFCRQQRLA